MKKFYLFSVFVIFLTKSLFAAPIIPDIYLGLQLGVSQNDLTYLNENNLTKTDISESNLSATTVLGIRPLDIPILGGFRFEVHYNEYFGDIKNKNIGGLVYYDFFRFLPFINPYLGAGIFQSTYELSEIEGLNQNYSSNQSNYSFHLGANLSVPLFPLDLFGEYKFTTNFASKDFEDFEEFVHTSHNFMLGVKYYILK